jgi:putative membrane protein
MKPLVPLTVAVFCVALAAAADRIENPAVTDQDFVMTATQAGVMEVQLGKLAEKHASDDAVKDFAHRMVKDHTAANDKLMAAAKNVKVAAAAAPDKEAQAAADKLAGLKGADFDKAYMRQMADDHQKAVSLFEAESKNGTDPALKGFAADALPMLQDHLKMAQSIYDKLKGK